MTTSKNIDKRLTAARNIAFGADAVFANLVKDYEDSAKLAEMVANEARRVKEAHLQVEQDAITHANEAREKASKVRELFGV